MISLRNNLSVSRVTLIRTPLISKEGKHSSSGKALLLQFYQLLQACSIYNETEVPLPSRYVFYKIHLLNSLGHAS